MICAIVSLLLLTACSPTSKDEQALESKIAELETIIENAYKPGFGDFMGSIQKHHNKLWFAGTQENWELASFEIHELEELFEDIKTYHAQREETKVISIIEPGLTAVEDAIEKQNIEAFKQGYTALTNSCNTCHHATKHEFIKITVPTVPAYTNQDFKRLGTGVNSLND